MVNEIIRIVPTLESIGLVGYNLRQLKKRKKKASDLFNMGVTNIVGAELIRETSDFANA